MVLEMHPKTEYDKGFYKPDASTNKDYLKATGMINVQFGQDDEEEEELPSSQHFMPTGTNNFSSQAVLQKFNGSISADRSDFGLSNASSQFGTSQTNSRMQTLKQTSKVVNGPSEQFSPA